MKAKNLFNAVCLISLVILASCKTTSGVVTQPTGPETGLTHKVIKHQAGFAQYRRQLLKNQGMTRKEFIRLSTDSAWHLTSAERERLHQLRVSIPRPDSTTLLQKVIAPSKVEFFRKNEKPVISGFVAVAADVKKLRTSSDVYHGLRLDYAGTKFTPNDKEYAVIRFYSNQTDHLRIPFCKEMGGPEEHSWPCSGGGFTTSTLGDGGIPEWVFDVDFIPKEGAEIYMIDNKGKETLTLVYRNGKWVEP